MSSLHVVNPRADLLRSAAASSANLNAASGLQDVLQSNLGPCGTLKMLVGGGGTLKLTKDGNVLLQEMQIQHPTAALIARGAVAQDSAAGDGSTSTVLLVGEAMKLLSSLVSEGVHPRVLCGGLERARKEMIDFLETMKVPTESILKNRELAEAVARCSLMTKVDLGMADQLSRIVVDAMRCVAGCESGEQLTDEQLNTVPLDLHMVEIMHMKHGLGNETRLVKGMVMDHGCRHPDMPSRLKNCFILTCNVSLEYEKSEVNSSFLYCNAQQRESLADAERRFTDEKVRRIIELKREVCTPENKATFVILNQKGIDPPSLDMLAKEGIMALRRVKRRNMERLVFCCGGEAVNSVDGLTKDVLGWAGEVHEMSLGDDKFTFVEEVKNPRSCAILIKGSTDYTIAQVKDALRDGLRALRNAATDKCLIPGAGAFEIACAHHLQGVADKTSGKEKLSLAAIGAALLVIPKTLARNAGFDSQDTLLEMQDTYKEQLAKSAGSGVVANVGFDIATGKPCIPSVEGIWDNWRVKAQTIAIAMSLLEQLLLVDEIMRAGRQMRK